jgi:RNA polymerase sigma factor (sigma-70 family)
MWQGQGSQRELDIGERERRDGGIADRVGLVVGMQESQAGRRDGRSGGGAPSGNERFAKAYEELRRPARAMVRRAFGNAFGDDDLEDLYGNAWLGTIRALETRHVELTDDELRRYVLAAVANQASRELRRRGRKPTTTLDAAQSVADPSDLPDERASRREEQELARDVLGSLPPRRRAVIMFRYGWGLEPAEVRALVKGLSPRAYRKEITRGVDEVGRKLRMADGAEWCEDREPLIQALAAGTADEEERRQATHHLAHCRRCAEYAGRLNGELHDLGAGIGLLGVLGAVADGRASLVANAVGWVAQVRDALTDAIARTSGAAENAIGQTALSVPSQGAGIGAVIAKLGGAGVASKAAVACLGSGVVAGACVASGFVPGEDAVRREAGTVALKPPSVREQERDPAPKLFHSPTAIANPSPPTHPPQPAAPTPPPTQAVDQPTTPAPTQTPEPAPEPEPVGVPDPVNNEFEPVGQPEQASGGASEAAPAPSEASEQPASTGSGQDFGP